jgi:predicted transcriptional regulator
MVADVKDYTTIRISRDLKDKLDNITLKSETYDEVLGKLIGQSHTTRFIEKSIIEELDKKKFVKLEDIEW